MRLSVIDCEYVYANMWVRNIWEGECCEISSNKFLQKLKNNWIELIVSYFHLFTSLVLFYYIHINWIMNHDASLNSLLLSKIVYHWLKDIFHNFHNWVYLVMYNT